jgi:hypothetical protein
MRKVGSVSNAECRKLSTLGNSCTVVAAQILTTKIAEVVLLSEMVATSTFLEVGGKRSEIAGVVVYWTPRVVIFFLFAAACAED